MGFGLLFIGYLLAYFMSLAFPLKLIGCIFMISGARRLSEYNGRFKLCVPPLGILCLISAYSLLCFVLSMLNIASPLASDTLKTVFAYIGEAVDMAYHACLLTAICSIAKETELPKHAYKSMRNLLIVLLAGVIYFVAVLLPKGEAASVLGIASTAMKILWIVLDLVLLANCYRLICPEGEEDMPAKESKIGFIRKMNEVIDKREENAKTSAIQLKEKRKKKK